MIGHLLLAVLGLCFTTAARAGSVHQAGYDRRATPAVNSSIPSPWNYLGCYTDSLFARTLNTEVYTDLFGGMTETKCVNYCGQRNYIYSGLEAGSECHCGNSLASSGTVATVSDCNFGCSGSGSEVCGGAFRLTVFMSNQTQTQQTINGWNALGCFSDNIIFRVFTGFHSVSFNNNTIENCLSTCQQKNFPYAGVEFGNECYCGSKPNPYPRSVSSTLCGSACTGNSSEKCGGWGTLNMFNFTGSGMHSLLVHILSWPAFSKYFNFTTREQGRY